MTGKGIKNTIREKGAFEAVLYYACRLMSKTAMVLIGRFTAKGSVKADRIVLKNRALQDFTDNPRALFEYLTEKGYHKDYEIIYMVSNKKDFRGKKLPHVKFVTAESPRGFTSPMAYYYGATAHFFFYTHNSADLNRYHGKGQVTVNLWHGCGYKATTEKNPNIPHSATMAAFDYAIVPGEIFVKTKAPFWGCREDQILTLGYPRYDWMLDPANDKRALLKRLFGWERETKTVIWMPTFRKSSMEGYGENSLTLPYDLPSVKDEAEMGLLDAHLRELDLLLIVKKHPFQIGWSEKKQDWTNIRYVTDQLLREREVLLYRLVGVCDGLLSDYSSVAVDYLLLDRPMGFVLADYVSYQDVRGFVFENPLEYMPGEKIYHFPQLLEFFTHIKEGQDPFREERRRLLPLMHNQTDHYCRRLAEYFLEEGK